MPMMRSDISRRGIILFVICLCSLTALHGFDAEDAAAQPTVRFASSQYAITESLANASIPLILDGDLVQNPTYVTISIQEGTAVAGTDYEMVLDTYVAFELFGPDTLQASFIIYDDEDPEDPETVLLTILDGGEAYSVGSPGTATLTIVDTDSGTPTAHFESPEDIQLNAYGHLVLAAEPGTSLEVDVVVDDLPPGGTTIHYSSTADGLNHSLEFTNDSRITIEVPPTDIPLGQAHAANTLQILNPVAAPRTGSAYFTTVFYDMERLHEDDLFCASCIISYFMISMGFLDCELANPYCYFDCPLETREDPPVDIPAHTLAIDLASDLQIMTRYRDEILASSPVGNYYVQLYRNHSAAVGTAILQRPALIHRVMEVWELWLPAVAAEVDGLGAGFMITGNMQTALLAVMTEFEEIAGPELAQLVADFRIELDLGNVAGTTATNLQEKIEANPMRNERASWGEVKSLFGERK